MKKIKNFILSLLITILSMIVMCVIFVAFNITTYDFFVGWISAMIFIYSEKILNLKNKITNNTIVPSISDNGFLYENENLKLENQKLKADLDYYKTRLENLKSDNIVNDSMKQ